MELRKFYKGIQLIVFNNKFEESARTIASSKVWLLPSLKQVFVFIILYDTMLFLVPKSIWIGEFNKCMVTILTNKHYSRRWVCKWNEEVLVKHLWQKWDFKHLIYSELLLMLYLNSSKLS